MCLECVRVSSYLGQWLFMLHTLEHDCLFSQGLTRRQRRSIRAGAAQLRWDVSVIRDAIEIREGVHVYRDTKTVEAFRAFLESLRELVTLYLMFDHGDEQSGRSISDCVLFWFEPDESYRDYDDDLEDIEDLKFP